MTAMVSRALLRLTLSLLAVSATLALNAQAQSASQPPVVVELFTSQACSSCPPADRFLGKLSEREDVIAMSMPVDYWDHLQWKDTLGRAEHSERQRRYASHLGLPSVYTPQMVINGSKNVIGSRPEAVEKAIREARQNGARVPVNIELEGKTFRVDIGAAADGMPRDAVILAVPLLSARTVDIERGENSGKSITYHNVSRSILKVGTWQGDATTLTLAHDQVMTEDADICAVILQDEKTGAILGAALLRDA